MSLTAADLLRAAERQGLVPGERVQQPVRDSTQDLSSFARDLALRCRVPLEALYRALAVELGLEYADLSRLSPAPGLAARLPRSLLRRARLLPLADADGGVVLASSEPSAGGPLEAVRRVLGERCKLAILEPEVHARMLDQVLDRAPATSERVDATALLDRLLMEAYLRRSSDIHLEPTDEGLRVRLRSDGVLRVVLEGLGRAERMALVSRVKVLAGLDIAEQRAPQDGSFRYVAPFLEPGRLEIRVASLPTDLGERLTLRLLGMEEADPRLEGLGLAAQDLELVRSVTRRPRGLVLIAGPTGSGKTTTLYAALAEIDRERHNVLTVEDPIERRLSGITQVRVGGSDKVTFATALRAFLRHDPDVILVGEIRDAETADAALKAAMTGHLVLSTVHTSTAAGAVARLVDLGVQPFRIAAALELVVAQRLVRRPCVACAKERDPLEHEAEFLGAATQVADPVGCPRCVGTGYRGRIGLFELLTIDRALAAAISRGVAGEELEDLAGERLRSLSQDVRAKARARRVDVREAMEAVVDRS